ncbi:uncharacterized protein K452DRAFT_302847 [Aplosporella prunicola CBS 121167]|uniref:Uncharacterized protein n=1 Tax=Aplosporella prunicola CBS 121167 TaxID=1176127 RepID=A0A6A6AZV6_9PEZI|nr:uncharacterized protein K452DRAFT_302847 [Aplosporella prunicola CBS 121167]KAF2136307.1 hypothetical protein K452DRAFT_302847 [Aplosporella prunicola CBS 121167]
MAVALNAGLITIPPDRDVLLMTNDCLNCHTGSCDLHDYFNYELAASVGSRYRPQCHAINLVKAVSILRKLPAELQINVLVLMQPLSSISLMDSCAPFNHLWKDHRTVIENRILETHCSVWRIFFPYRTDGNGRNKHLRGLMDAGFSFSQYFMFVEKISYATGVITHYLMRTFDIDTRTLEALYAKSTGGTVDRTRGIYNSIFHLWCYFSYLPTCPLADRERSIWDYIISLPQYQQKGLLTFLHMLGKAYNNKYPVSYDGRFSERQVRELQFYGIEESLVAYAVMEHLRQGMRLVRCQVFDSRPVDLDFAFGDPATWWSRQPLPAVRVPPTWKFISQDTYLVRFTGSSTAGSIDVWIPVMDMLKGITMAINTPQGTTVDMAAVQNYLTAGLQYRIPRWDYWNFFESRPGYYGSRRLYLDRLFGEAEYEST